MSEFEQHPHDQEPRVLSLSEVPEWHQEPGTGLWEFGKPLDEVTLHHHGEMVPVNEDVAQLRDQLETHTTPTFFNGPFANVRRISFDERRVDIETDETDFFTYLASAFAHRDREGENPVRPLAVQATIFSPDGNKMTLERRPTTLADFPGKLSVFGGALKPNEHPTEAILTILNRKLGLGLQPHQIHPSGLVRENIDNIYCVTYTVDLTPEQYASGSNRAKTEVREGRRQFYQMTTEEAQRSLERTFTQKRQISEWDPNAFYNVLYAFGAKGLRTPEQLNALVAQNHDALREHPLAYRYPIEKYLGEKS